jgi:hypothetical protein
MVTGVVRGGRAQRGESSPVVDGARDAPERRARWPWQDWERGGRQELMEAGKESERMMAEGVERTGEGRAPFIGWDGALGRR